MSAESREPVVAIDGPSGAGKSTVSRSVARSLGFTYIDTGAMYRAVALAAQRAAIAEHDDQGLSALCSEINLYFKPVRDGQHIVLNGEDVERLIRTPEISLAASAVSARPAVRRAMVDLQRRMGAAGGVVMEGRDIGSHVFPDAEVKIFLCASALVRAQRRNCELAGRGIDEDLSATLEQMRKRDADDSSRELAPLIRVADAHELDTTELSLEQVIGRVLEIVEQARKK
ncbi:MAG: (d)CMP kinase [Candidatus Alcyoniella australis]|nr:(d)CMP kinase [Candidatus Alcyoniella australis]